MCVLWQFDFDVFPFPRSLTPSLHRCWCCCYCCCRRVRVLLEQLNSNIPNVVNASLSHEYKAMWIKSATESERKHWTVEWEWMKRNIEGERAREREKKREGDTKNARTSRLRVWRSKDGHCLLVVAIIVHVFVCICVYIFSSIGIVSTFVLYKLISCISATRKSTFQ